MKLIHILRMVLNEKDIYAALSYAADRENKIYQIAV